MLYCFALLQQHNNIPATTTNHLAYIPSFRCPPKHLYPPIPRHRSPPYTKAAATAAAPPRTPNTAGAAVGMANALLEELDLAADADADAELELLPAEL
jgi:hypothetical protein